MVHIKLKKYEQLYTVADNKKVVALSIDLDRENNTVIVHRRFGESVYYSTDDIGVVNIYTEIDRNIKDFFFFNE